MNKIWRCDLKSPCVKLCESKNDKDLCGVNIRDKTNKFIDMENKIKKLLKTDDTYIVYKKLNISKSSYYTMRSRKSIPYKKIIELCLREKFDLNYVFGI